MEKEFNDEFKKGEKVYSTRREGGREGKYL